MTRTKTSRVLIVDDHAMLREGLSLFISEEPDLEVIGTVADGETALETLQDVQPDVVTVDLSMPGINGLEFIHQSKAQYPDVRILVVSMHRESTYAERCLKAGALGYVTKKEPPEAVVAAIRKVLRGEVAVSGQVSARLLRRMTAHASPASVSDLDVLSNRELEVFELLGHGYTTRQIADQVSLSIKTVQYYRETIKQKLDLQNAAELTHRAVTWVHSLGNDESAGDEPRRGSS